MKILNAFFLAVLLTLLTACVETSTSQLCIPRIKGRIISTGPACAGLAVQILSESFDRERVDSLWINTFTGDTLVYKNVFTVYPSCAESIMQEELQHLAQNGGDFYFIFNSPVYDSTTLFPNCRCKPLPSVTLPLRSHRILLATEECNDLVGLE